MSEMPNESDVFARLGQQGLGLPFVENDEGSVNWWKPISKAADEIEHGELLAIMTLMAAKACNEPLIIALVLRDMVRSGSFGGLEAGFLGKIAMTSQAGAMN